MATTLERGAAEQELAALTEAGQKLATAKRDELEFHDLKPVEKLNAIRRIMKTENEETKKPHSASSAERIVETDAVYADYMAECRESVVDRITAETNWHAALLRAQLAVRAVGGVQ